MVLNGTIINQNGWVWKLGMNLTHYKNKVTDLPLKDMPRSGVNKLQVGRSVYDFYMIEWAGVDPEMEIRCGIWMRKMQIKIRLEDVSQQTIIVRLTIIMSISRLFRRCMADSIRLFPGKDSIFRPSLPIVSVDISTIVI